MKSLISTAFTWTLKKLGISSQLFIGYALLVVAAGAAGVGAVLYAKNATLEQKVDAQLTRIVTAEVTIANQQVALDEQYGTINDLRISRALDSGALQALISDFSTLAARDASVQQKLNNLEMTNETIRAYMDGTVPPDVACVFDDTCTTGAGSGQTGLRAGVPPASAAPTVPKVSQDPNSRKP